MFTSYRLCLYPVGQREDAWPWWVKMMVSRGSGPQCEERPKPWVLSSNVLSPSSSPGETCTGLCEDVYLGCIGLPSQGKHANIMLAQPDEKSQGAFSWAGSLLCACTFRQSLPRFKRNEGCCFSSTFVPWGMMTVEMINFLPELAASI